MSKLKVWCETCEADGKDRTGRHPLGDCTECGGDGYTLREVVELPDGRAVVVDAKAWEAALEATPNDYPYDKTVVLGDVIAALFTGGVYEAEAVGTATEDVERGGLAVGCGDGSIAKLDEGDLIAVGLKEVGK